MTHVFVGPGVASKLYAKVMGIEHVSVNAVETATSGRFLQCSR